MDSYLSVFTKQDHLKTLLDNDVPHLVGNSIDEFIRHHPSLKESVMESIIKMLKKVVDVSFNIKLNERAESRMGQFIDVYSRVIFFKCSFWKVYFKTLRIVKI